MTRTTPNTKDDTPPVIDSHNDTIVAHIGGGTLLKDAEEYRDILEGLLARRYSDDQIRKILGGNTLRVLQQTIG
jgi:hypothetical protein